MALEKLLNIKEAAGFLNVSDMTVRRWTNNGTLPCYRIGGRMARRFRLRDLQTFLERNPASLDSGQLSLGTNGLMVSDGAHVTHLSLDDQESVDVALSYLVEGLRQDETVVMICPEAFYFQVAPGFATRNVDLDSMKNNGRWHVSSGMEKPENQIRYIVQTALNASGRFRLFGNMAWALEKRWSAADMLELEKTTDSLAGPGVMLLCQYPLSNFDGKTVMMAVENHTHILYRGLLEKSPYHHPDDPGRK